MDRRPDSSSARRGPTPQADAAAQAAADWVVRRDRGLTAEEGRALGEWRGADAQHAAELARMEAAWRSLDGMGGAAELQAMADAVVIRARARQRRSRMLGLQVAVLAAAAAVVAGFVSWSNFNAESPVLLDTANKNYRVLASSLQRTILPDGSVAELNGASRIEVEYSPHARHVRLTEGEAHFVVAKNPDRPFFVSAGAVTVRAVGTAFNVRIASEVIEVLVTEGQVKLESSKPSAGAPETGNDARPTPSVAPAGTPVAGTELVAGQRAVISRAEGASPASAAVGEVDRAGIDEALGWQSTRLVFNNTPLSEVVEGFNRCNAHRLTIGDPSIRDRALTGVFRADNIEGFVRLLRHSIDVKAELRTPTETVLLRIR